MKKRFLAIAIAAGLASPFAANADATVFGKVNMSVGTVDEGTGGADNIQVRSHASRLGFKGSEDLGNGMTAKFHIEYGYDHDGSGSGLSKRNQFIGLKGGFGEVRVGRHDTPLKISQGKFDQFGDMDGDIAVSGLSGGDIRVGNAIAYINKFGSVTVAAALVPGEGDGTTSGGDGIADTTSIAAMYKEGPLYVALAMDSYDDTAGGVASALNAEGRTRLTATYMMGKMQFGFMWEDVDGGTTANDADGMGLSFGMGMGKNKVKFQYLTGEEDNSGEATSMSVGYDWGLSKRTTAYVSYNDMEEEDTAGNTTAEKTTMVAGMIHNF